MEDEGIGSDDVATGLESIPLIELAAQRIRIDAELSSRGYLRTAGPLVGQLMEHVVAEAYGGVKTTPGSKSIDVQLSNGRGVQVKARSLPATQMRFWTFSDVDFDLAVVIHVERGTGNILWAREFTPAKLEPLLHRAPTGKLRLRMRVALVGGVDVTTKLRTAYHRMR